ncbi:RBR-type E3 ubiquitin transferase [Ranunculus cassubicifolius]
MDSDDSYYSEGGYSDDDGGFSEEEDNDGGFCDGDDETPSRMEANFTVLSEEIIESRQEEDINEISNVLSVSKQFARALLRNYNWNVSVVTEAWFADEEKVKKTLGLFEAPIVCYRDSEKLMCRICFDDFRRSVMYATSCGHPFCGTCWKSYISIAIQDGAGCLTLRCPDPKCVSIVDQDLVNQLVEKEDKEKYSRYLMRSYVEYNKKAKWCPAPGCEYAVEYVLGSGSYDVNCNCTNSFCWNCSEDAHRPVDCETVAKWVLKNSAESENVTWILANSKPCPKCKRPIQKNQGCMHMTCHSSCKYEFCWLCLGAWSEHGERTGGYYACNSYEKGKQEGKYDEAERKREMAQNVLEKYTHYFERWDANDKSRKKAKLDFKKVQDVQVDKLRNKLSIPLSEVSFVIHAWLQIIECRRVLKWTYAYGFYLSDEEEEKKKFFEYLQGEAESWLERLHQLAEKDLDKYLDAEESSEELKGFNNFRQKLANETRITRNYFDNLVRALENGLSDVSLPTNERTRTRIS